MNANVAQTPGVPQHAGEASYASGQAGTSMVETTSRDASVLSPGGATRSLSGSHPPGHALTSNPTGHSFGAHNTGTQFVQPADESVAIEQQLPDFMKVDENNADKHRNPHRHREMLRRRLQLKNNGVAFLSELVGTILFLFFSFGIATEASNARSASQNNNVDQGTQSLSQNAPPDTSALLYSSLGFGFSLAVNAWTFYRVSGGLFNPAVTLALTLTGTLNWFQCLHLTVAQIIGGIAAAALCDGLLPGPINARTSLSSGISIAQGFWLEFFLTAQLIFAIFMLAAEKHRSTFLAPVGIGLALFIAELLGTNYTGGSLNPARSFGPDVVLGKFDGYHWIYWVAPYSAAIVTAGFYMLLKYLQYESVNAGQDSDDTTQVIRDASGNIIGILDTVAAHEYQFVKEPVTSSPFQQQVNATREGVSSSINGRQSFHSNSADAIRSRSEHGNSTLNGHLSPTKREFDTEKADQMA